jgi:hypothetical protein
MIVKDDGTWNRIIQRGEGVIYNDSGTQFRWDLPDFNKLHKTSCRSVRRMTFVSKGKLTKFFFKTREEAIDWLVKNRKEDGYVLCKICCP